MKKKIKPTVKAPIEDIPEPVMEDPQKTDIFLAKVVQQAKNPQWVFCVAPGKDLGKIAVAIPRRLSGKLEGKFIQVEAISDSTGVSYRYVEGQPH
jgi:hypothetical protein